MPKQLSGPAEEKAPDQALMLNDRGVALQAQGRTNEALAEYDGAIMLNAGVAQIHYNRGGALQALRRFGEALAAYDRAIALEPDYPNAHNNRGNALRELNRHKKALAAYDAALALRPDFADAHNNRGNALRNLRRHEEALIAFNRALALKPDFAEAHYNRGFTLQEMRRHEEALAAYDRAIALKPDYANAWWNKACVKLITGDFKSGWPLYEWRWRRSDYPAPKRDFAQPVWRGDFDISGKTILLHAEQGFGDTIQFCRYVKLVAARGAKVILEVQPALKKIMQSLEGVTHAVAQSEELPPFDCYAPLLSLPLAFGTEPGTIPAEIPYLHAPEEAIAHWHVRLGEKRAPRVGIVWAGNPQQKNDRNRSMKLIDFLPLASAGVEFFSLQKDMNAAERIMLAGVHAIKNIGGELADFSETAAVIAHMDLVISVCTSVAHLAAAMGKPVWLLLSHAACWRWLLDRDDSPWYPSMRLFRQPELGDWASVVDTVARELRGFS